MTNKAHVDRPTIWLNVTPQKHHHKHHDNLWWQIHKCFLTYHWKRKQVIRPHFLTYWSWIKCLQLDHRMRDVLILLFKNNISVVKTSSFSLTPIFPINGGSYLRFLSHPSIFIMHRTAAIYGNWINRHFLNSPHWRPLVIISSQRQEEPPDHLSSKTYHRDDQKYIGAYINIT